ncbi:hypothetical protein BS329_32900 [Amycolatopsis coloradensis]|uniref:Uncharacterized protein n=1 Tax=Amycolatopsis coloradensis TaxID=76021 RepID=A0A1R0KHP0_9PSEU|nr:hypothetical protein [Amycolatopsis coloradensis]OLZ45245.1 hypothetical protein BS329_32900 [Amycolatopsis coloradensis]
MTGNDEFDDRNVTALYEEYDELLREVVHSRQIEDPTFRHPRLAEVGQKLGDMLIEQAEYYHRRAARWRDGA